MPVQSSGQQSVQDLIGMASSDANPSDGGTDLDKDPVCVIRPGIRFLGEALTPVVRSARRAMARQANPSGEEFLGLTDLSRHMDLITQAMTQLSRRFESLKIDVMQNEAAGALDAGRSAGQFDQVLITLIDGYQDAEASQANPETSEARSLILAIYRHHISEFCNWLEDLIAAIANPALAMQQRGIASADHVQLQVTLNMTSPPEMGLLVEAAKRLLPPPETDDEASPEFEGHDASGPEDLGPVAASAFGVEVTKAGLGRNHG